MTGENWPDVLWTGIDAVAPDVAPERRDFAPSALFFILWIIAGNFMALNRARKPRTDCHLTGGQTRLYPCVL